MPYIERALTSQIPKAARAFPAVLLTGPRQCGKTTLLKRLYPRASYVLLEDPDVVGRVRSDPRTFMESLRPPVILDEIQNAPELFNYVRARIDAAPSRRGQWLLTGSQEAPLMQGVTESMAGRVAVLHLLPLSTLETSKVNLIRGGYPGAISRPSAAQMWFRSYIQTYLERDVRAVTAVRDLGSFRRFLALLASRTGSILNKTDLAAPLGVSVPTISEWLNALEVTGQILTVPPFYENFGKRLIKSPKVYFVDSGVACHLLGIDHVAALQGSTFSGPLFEGFVAAEIAKQQVNRGDKVELYYFRDQQGLEVDFVVPRGPRRLSLVEAKATKTPTPTMAQSLVRLAGSIKDYETSCFVVHSDAKRTNAGRALLPGISAVTLQQLLVSFMPALKLICEAIRKRALLAFVYDGRPRVVAPYCYGTSTANMEVLRAIEVRGARSAGPGFSKLWNVAKMENLRILNETFTPDDPNYNPHDRAMAQIHCRIELVA